MGQLAPTSARFEEASENSGRTLVCVEEVGSTVGGGRRWKAIDQDKSSNRRQRLFGPTPEETGG